MTTAAKLFDEELETLRNEINEELIYFRGKLDAYIELDAPAADIIEAHNRKLAELNGYIAALDAAKKVEYNKAMKAAGKMGYNPFARNHPPKMELTEKDQAALDAAEQYLFNRY